MNVLVVAAHPDDEILGCGGTIAMHALLQGAQVHVLIMAEGITARDITRNREQHEPSLSKLAQAAHQANRIVGTTTLELLSFPDNRLDSVDLLDLVKAVEEVITKHDPSIVYTHHRGDVNIDHQRVHEAVIAACRPQPLCGVKRLLFFEVASSTEWQPPFSGQPFAPNWFVNISGTLDHKLKALEAYASEMRAFPHPRSLKAIECLAHWRGATVGVQAAEAFVLGREIVGK